MRSFSTMDEISNSEQEKCRDTRLLKALRTPPLSRKELKAELKRAREAEKLAKANSLRE